MKEKRNKAIEKRVEQYCATQKEYRIIGSGIIIITLK